MTIYTITATWGAMKLSEEMDVKSDLTPENEGRYAENFILEKWIRIFGDQFINGADTVSTRAVATEPRCSSCDAHSLNREVEAFQ